MCFAGCPYAEGACLCDPNLYPPNYEVPDPEVINSYLYNICLLQVAPMLNEFGYDPNLNLPNYGVPDPEVTNSDLYNICLLQVAPMLKELGYDPNLNPPNYGVPDPEVTNNTKNLEINRYEKLKKR